MASAYNNLAAVLFGNAFRFVRHLAAVRLSTQGTTQKNSCALARCGLWHATPNAKCETLLVTNLSFHPFIN